MRIGDKIIGQGHPVFIVAEISGNHNQSFEKAKKLVKTACECGVDAVKLQTYTPDTMTIDCDSDYFQVKVNEAWKGKTLYELYQTAYTPWEWFPALKRITDKYGVILFSTPFDKTAVDFLEMIRVSLYKIASFEITDVELIHEIALTKKPVIISRGMSSFGELKTAISILRQNSASGVVVLHCVSSYPARPEEMNLLTIPDIKKKLGVEVGLSDHTLTTAVSVASVALGASIIEKHFTLRRSDGGPDAGFSLEPEELKQLVCDIRTVEKALGQVRYGAGEKEAENIVFRRSLFVVRDIRNGERFTRKNIRCIRPGYGLAPIFLPKVLGKKANKDIKKGTPLSWKEIGNE